MPDLWLTCDHFVGKVFAMGEPTRPTQSIKRQTRAGYGWLVIGQSGCRLSLRPIGCTPALSDMNSTIATAVCGLWRYASIICLCLAVEQIFFLLLHTIVAFENVNITV